MPEEQSPKWLKWAREIQAIGQTGFNLTEGYYDRQNYARLLQIAAEMTALHSPVPREEVLAAFRAQPGYATVKVDVRGAVVWEDRILLVQERRDERWCMPGGWADVGDRPSEMVAREVVEESGFSVEPYRVVGIYDANREGRPMEFFHAYKIVLLCRILGGEARTSDETMGVEFFPFDRLPPLSVNRTSERHVRDVQNMLADPHLQPVFD